MKAEVSQPAGRSRKVSISYSTGVSLAIGSVIGGAFLSGVVAVSLRRLLGWQPVIANSLGFLLVWPFLYAPMKLWSDVRGKQPISGFKFFSVAIAASAAVWLLGQLVGRSG